MNDYILNWCRGDLQIYYKTLLWLEEELVIKE